MNQGIGPRRTNTEPPCYKGNKCRTCPFGFPTGLGPDGPREIHAVTLQFNPQSVGTSSTKHGKVVPQPDDQVIILLRKSGTTFKEINQHTQESHASHCDSHWSAVAYVIDSPNRREDSYVIHTQPTSADIRDSCRIDTSADVG